MAVVAAATLLGVGEGRSSLVVVAVVVVVVTKHRPCDHA
jgi:hypothetical protein